MNQCVSCFKSIIMLQKVIINENKNFISIPFVLVIFDIFNPLFNDCRLDVRYFGWFLNILNLISLFPRKSFHWSIISLILLSFLNAFFLFRQVNIIVNINYSSLTFFLVWNLFSKMVNQRFLKKSSILSGIRITWPIIF